MRKHLPLLFLVAATIAGRGGAAGAGEQPLIRSPTTAPAAATTAPAPAGTAPAPGAASPWPELDWFNSRPIPPGALRVLYIGDSLTVHGTSPGLWDHYSGMAATDAAHDFLHLTAGHIQRALAPRPVEALLDNGGNGKIGAMLQYLERHPELKPDLVVLQGGENDAFDDSFRQTYTRLLEFYSVPVIVAGDWWSADKSNWEKQQAAARKHPFVDLAAMNAIPANSGDGGPFGVEGVARHPSNAGHAAIAKGINDAFDGLPR